MDRIRQCAEAVSKVEAVSMSDGLGPPERSRRRLRAINAVTPTNWNLAVVMAGLMGVMDRSQGDPRRSGIAHISAGHFKYALRWLRH